MKHDAEKRKTVLVTGANGYVGNAVAKAFSRAGWKVFGLIRNQNGAPDLAKNEIHPVIGTPEDLSSLRQISDLVFDVIVSNTEDRNDPVAHLGKVKIMLDELVQQCDKAGVKPIIMFSSGCKDYGKMTEKHGDAGLAAHTEESPMNPPVQLAARKDLGLVLLESKDARFDAIVLRPTIVYGHSSSHYGSLFKLAQDSESVLKLRADPDAVMHSLHVDDCGDAYVTLAEHPVRAEVIGQAFNISNARYETAQEVGEALAKSYGLKLEFDAPAGEIAMSEVHSLANFWQWVSSDKLRAITGWREKRTTFTQGMDEYRLAYEASNQD